MVRIFCIAHWWGNTKSRLVFHLFPGYCVFPVKSMHSFPSFCSVLIRLPLFLCVLQVFNMFHHRSLGIRINIRVTKLVLLHSRPVSQSFYIVFMYICLYTYCIYPLSISVLTLQAPKHFFFCIKEWYLFILGKAEGGASRGKIPGQLLQLAVSGVWWASLSWHQPHSRRKRRHSARGHSRAGHQVCFHHVPSMSRNEECSEYYLESFSAATIEHLTSTV